MKIVAIAVLLFSSFIAYAESVESKIEFNVSRAVVVPTDLHETCVGLSEINGPRVRLGASIMWSGKGKLIPLYANLVVENSQLKSQYNELLMPRNSDNSISYIFGTDESFLSTGQTYYTDSCFLDFGNLPLPRTQLAGTDQLIVKAQLTLVGYVETGLILEPVVFEKTVPVEIIYVLGSVVN